MIDIEELKPLIVERLKPLNPDKIILFGSYAYGTPTEESDIDLHVVTRDDFMLRTWREKSNLSEIRKKASPRSEKLSHNHHPTLFDDFSVDAVEEEAIML